MGKSEIQGRCILHKVDNETAECSCRFTHWRNPDGSWDVTREADGQPLTEIPPLYDGGSPDIYRMGINW